MNFENLWNALPNPAFLIEGDNRISAANQAAEDFMNTSAKSLVGMRCVDLINVFSPLESSFERVRQSQSPLFINEAEVGQIGGQIGGRAMGAEIILCNIQIAPMSRDDPQVLLMISPLQNLKGASQKTASRSAVRSAIGMAEMLAHEIKNPLAGITGAAQLLAMSLPAQDLEITDLIVSEARRIVSLLDQVEQFGDLSPPRRVAVNIHDVVDRARKSARLGIAANMRIIQEYDPSLPDTWADADQLIQVVTNLLANAAQAAENTGDVTGGKSVGEIRIHTSFDNSHRLRRSDGSDAALPILIRIIDDGPGLPPDIADQVFDPFVSGRENGTGLGLALVSKIIAEHEGQISVTSRPGRTEFRISLPEAPRSPKVPRRKGT
ncbi:ATPase [Marinosulfonomonas sp. PRT-SC04]|nr:ATPase [Marinosulfonomonas sp. PRT-SC04]